jgi:hypothetical protein
MVVKVNLYNIFSGNFKPIPEKVKKKIRRVKMRFYLARGNITRKVV